MAGTGKRRTAAAEHLKRAALVEALRSLPPKSRKTYFIGVGDLMVIVDASAKTLMRARKLREGAISAGVQPDPLHLASIAYIMAGSAVEYPASAVLAFLERKGDAAEAAEELAASLPASKFAAAMGFHSWLAQGDAAARWPFLNPSGRRANGHGSRDRPGAADWSG